MDKEANPATAAGRAHEPAPSAVARAQTTSPPPSHASPRSAATRSAPSPAVPPITPALSDPPSKELMLALSYTPSLKAKQKANLDVRRFLTESQDMADDDRDRVAMHLLSLTSHHDMFTIPTISSLVRDLQARNRLKKIPAGLMASALVSVLKQPTPNGSADELVVYKALSSVLLLSLSSRRPAVAAHSSHKTSHMQTLWVVFKVVRRLIQLGEFKTVMPIFDELVKSGAIPSEALANLPSSGFAHIILTALLRCCVDFGWTSRAAQILLEMPQWELARSPSFDQTLQEVVNYVLDAEEEPNSPMLAAAFMVRIVNNPDIIILPPRVLMRFYDIMHRHGLVEQAMAVWRVTRAPAVVAKHRYPAPNRESFMWLFRAAIREKKLHTARQLVKELVDEEVEIHQLERAYVLIEAASHGFMTYARGLWERWKQDVFVVGDPGTALRLVSLVRNRISSLMLRTKLAQGRTKQSSMLGIPNADADAREASEPSQLDLDLAQDVTPSPVDGISDYPAAPRPADAPEEEHPDLSFEERIAEYRAFAENVVKTLRAAHEPIERAPHKVLNAMSRLYIMLGDVDEGFAMLKLILGGGQVPDVFDVNVALSGLAPLNPRAAARIVERMLRLGIKPDAVTFGTVIHHAVLVNDMPLVTALITRSRQAGIQQLNYKTIGTLIRSAISMPYEEDSPHEERLRSVESLVYSLVDAGYTVSAGIGTDCIHVALRADKPVTAFDFWQLLVDGKVEHTDYKQAALRTRIARNLVRHARAGVLPEAKKRSMLWELGIRPSSDGSLRWLEEEDTKQERP
ncbi:hypothetical protein PsYK624_044580 [Phanerochaete sordida]|uniref:Pentacotripeptide-repeat region of PRORP domain-containing protein n=1 Tax=Phanerochaete sordida TaxID=48140 RepID=A0A9P3LAN5_9APHY|nr:hypothetical protein PsYK624_044580 [Phanerochaete sordida]